MQTPFKLSIACALVAVSGLSWSQEQVVRIGHVGPVSGPIAHLGKDNENGARLAIEELNARGVSIAGKKVRFELIAEDDAADHMRVGRDPVGAGRRQRRGQVVQGIDRHGGSPSRAAA